MWFGTVNCLTNAGQEKGGRHHRNEEYGPGPGLSRVLKNFKTGTGIQTPGFRDRYRERVAQPYTGMFVVNLTHPAQIRRWNNYAAALATVATACIKVEYRLGTAVYGYVI